MRQCRVCGKEVALADEQDHLNDQHLGPHYFWFDMRKYRTMKPSMTVTELKTLVDCSRGYLVVEDRDGKEIWYSDGEAVDLTHTPHFFTVPAATSAPRPYD